MLEATTVESLRVYCSEHALAFPCTRARQIVCEKGHELSNDFPYEKFWDYCCDCNVFALSHAIDGKEAGPVCPCCGREIARRFLCDSCKTMTVASAVVNQSRLIEIAESGSPSPSCPGCLKTAIATLAEHDCYTLFVSYSTPRTICPFCNELINRPLPLQISHDKDSAFFRRGAGRFSFPILESIAQRHDWLTRVRSLLPRSKTGWLELGGVIGLLLTTIGVLIALFPSVPGAVWWRASKTLNTSPRVMAIESSRYVLEGQRLNLRARVEDHDVEQLRFDWDSSPVGKIHGSGRDVELITDGVPAQAVPFEITIGVKVTDSFGESASRQERITVVPARMAHTPPVFKIPPRCNCTNPEVLAGENVSFYALAEDEDKNETLKYEWRSSLPAAQIIDTNYTPGSTVILETSGINPRAIAVPVKLYLKVTDRNGGEVAADVTVMVLPKQLFATKEAAPAQTVRPNQSPKLEAFTADKLSVAPGEIVRLWALVTDQDGDSPLFYSWKSSAGEIANQNETAILNTSGVNPSQVIVSVTVNDGHGGSTSQRLFLTVNPPANKTPTPSPSPPVLETKTQKEGD